MNLGNPCDLLFTPDPPLAMQPKPESLADGLLVDPRVHPLQLTRLAGALSSQTMAIERGAEHRKTGRVWSKRSKVYCKQGGLKTLNV